ncbi:hypothetical protein IAG44_19525 [Streptomyces roseirectus]|uniref:PIN domain-containing protein n=1 Tax=Streptomyces roseirectus TaxID=2768066 RepID=A0A7H0IF40_9ACTN|nr:hypothetical protein [Streptomyces roseirectus]QNP71406.1 hypothetical protein IAG44_19525 [Streptomyces roseirectus]
MSRQHRSGLQLPVVDFLDTSVFVEILNVPYMNDHRDEVLSEMDARLKASVRFVLPTATVIETGNHIFQIGEGTLRRDRAASFMSLLHKTASGEAPWVLHERTWDGSFLTSLCNGGTTGMNLAEHALHEQLGAGDLSIVAERDLYASKVQAKVRIWTLEAVMGTWAELP